MVKWIMLALLGFMLIMPVLAFNASFDQINIDKPGFEEKIGKYVESCLEECDSSILSHVSFDYIDSCRSIRYPGVYVLKNDLYAESSCLEISSNNVILLCDDKNITHSAKSPGTGITIKQGNRIAIAECNIIEGNQFSSKGIMVFKSKSLLIKNNDFLTNSDSSESILIRSSEKIMVSDNKIRNNKGTAIKIIDSSKIKALDNKIRSDNIVSTAFGIFGNSTNNFFVGNDINTSGTGFLLDLSESDKTRTKIFSNKIVSSHDLNVERSFNDSLVEFVNQKIRKYSLPSSGIMIRIERVEKASIDFLVPIESSSNDGTSLVRLDSNFVSVDSSLSPEFNKPAVISFYNMSLNLTTPAILRNGAVCGFSEGCINMSPLDNETIMIEVPGFSNYSIGESISGNTEESTQTESTPSGGIGLSSSCSTAWVCSEWSECNPGEIQTRTCTKQNIQCFAEERPEESRICIIEENPEELPGNNEGIISRITGAVIGVGGAVADNPIMTLLAALLLAVLIYMFVFFRNKKNK